MGWHTVRGRWRGRHGWGAPVTRPSVPIKGSLGHRVGYRGVPQGIVRKRMFSRYGHTLHGAEASRSIRLMRISIVRWHWWRRDTASRGHPRPTIIATRPEALLTLLLRHVTIIISRGWWHWTRRTAGATIIASDSTWREMRGYRPVASVTSDTTRGVGTNRTI